MLRRPEVIYETVERYQFLNDQSKKLIKEFSEKLRLVNESLELKELETYISSWLELRKKDDLVVSNPSEDFILDKLLVLYDNKVGRKYSKTELDEIYTEGRKRYDALIPPGYKDDKKNKEKENSGFGDLILWKQVMEYCKEKEIPIIFVTHDQKEDWWQIIKGKTVGTRPELLREFFNQTNNNLLMYTMNSFLEIMKSEENQSISDEVFEEIENFSYVNDDLTNMLLKSESSHNNYIKNILKNIESLQHQIHKREDSIKFNEKSYEKKKNPNTLVTLENTKEKLAKYKEELNKYYKELGLVGFPTIVS
jgi:hypothetical protein